MKIRPVTDLRNHFPDVESALKESGTVYLTKNGYGTAVLLSIDEYTKLTGEQSLPLSSKSISRKRKASSGRGFLSKYVDPDRIPLEKDAGRIHAAKKYGKSVSVAVNDNCEATSDE